METPSSADVRVADQIKLVLLDSLPAEKAETISAIAYRIHKRLFDTQTINDAVEVINDRRKANGQ